MRRNNACALLGLCANARLGLGLVEKAQKLAC